METNINIYVLFTILLIHWVADFVFQTHEQASKKSTSNNHLTMHVGTYTLTWLVSGVILAVYMLLSYHCDIFNKVAIFCAVTFVCHWITDYFTSRLNSYLYKKGDIHNFFVSYGFDQILHYIQLILTFQLLN